MKDKDLREHFWRLVERVLELELLVTKGKGECRYCGRSITSRLTAANTLRWVHDLDESTHCDLDDGGYRGWIAPSIAVEDVVNFRNQRRRTLKS